MLEDLVSCGAQSPSALRKPEIAAMARNSRRFAFQLAEQARGRDHNPRDERGQAGKQQDFTQDSGHCSLHNVDVLVLSETSAACASATATKLAALRRRRTLLIDIVVPQIASRGEPSPSGASLPL